MDKVIVIMSTYNGEKYLQEQIDSVLSQVNVEVELWVRDDGSSDKTLDILHKYQSEGKIVFIEGANIGYRKSFMSLCHMVHEADYYAFCDQDDVWQKNKLSRMIDAIRQDDECPAVGISDLQMVDEDLNPINNDSSFFIDYSELTKRQLQKLVSIETIMIGYGCTQVWNNALQKLALNNRKETTINHDYVIGILGIFCGRFIAVPEKLINYRQHGNNTSGNRNGIHRIKTNMMRHLETLSRKRIDPISSVDQEMIDCYGHLFDQEGLKIIKQVANYKKSFGNKIKLLRSDYYDGLRPWDIIKTKIKIWLRIL